MSALPTARLVAYGALAAPLAMLSLPVYVHIPKFYAEQFGLALGTQGALLLAAASFALFAPPANAVAHIAQWFFAMLMLVYAALALVQISYHAYGAELSGDAFERTRVTAIREGLALGGILAGAVLPQLCATALGPRPGYARFGVLVVLILLAATFVSLRYAPSPRALQVATVADNSWWSAITRPLANPAMRRLLTVFVLSGTANAIAATLVLFYVDDVIGRGDLGAVGSCAGRGSRAAAGRARRAYRCRGRRRARLSGRCLFRAMGPGHQAQSCAGGRPRPAAARVARL